MSEIIIYQTSDNQTTVEVQFEDETCWLSLNQIAELFERDKSVISRHLKNIYKKGELEESATVAKNATVQMEANRTVKRELEYYNLDAILCVGYRVNSKRGTQFRQWATQRLRDYLLKGYAINEKRLALPKDKSFESSIRQIEQSFDNNDLYKSIEEKAAMILYLIVKNHSFVDGNKRIGAACFLYFLQKNGVLFSEEKMPLLSSEAIAALTLFVATSKPNEMETVKQLIISLLNRMN